MKFYCTQTTLFQGVSIVQRAVSTKNTMSMLGCIYLEVTDDNKLILRTTDLEISIEHIINVQTIEPGKVVIPAKYFIDIVRHLPNDEINFIVDNEALIITYGKSKLTINSYPFEEFPNLPVISKSLSFTISSAILKKCSKQVIIATSLDNNRPVFTGVLLEIKNDNEIKIVATDTHRLAYKTAKVNNIENNSGNETTSIIVPGKILTEISRILDAEGIINLTIGKNNQVVFSFENTSIFSRLIEGQFPNYKQVIPSNFVTNAKIKTKDFLNSLERAALLIREEDNKKRANNIKLKFTKNDLTIDSYAQEVGNIHEELNIELEGEEIEISFNARYLLEALKVMEEEFISFKFTGPLSPAIIKPDAFDDYLYLILPVRSN